MKIIDHRLEMVNAKNKWKIKKKHYCLIDGYFGDIYDVHCIQPTFVFILDRFTDRPAPR